VNPVIVGIAMSRRADVNHAWFGGSKQGREKEVREMEVAQDVGPELKVVVVLGQLVNRSSHHAAAKCAIGQCVCHQILAGDSRIVQQNVESVLFAVGMVVNGGLSRVHVGVALTSGRLRLPCELDAERSNATNVISLPVSSLSRLIAV
jgi:hypothetical protein